MVIQIDTREKPKAIGQIVKTFDTQGIKCFRSKLFAGDYMNMDNPRLVIDRKQNLLEVCNNVCQDHKRFVAELKRANEYGIKIIFLVEHSENISKLEDVANWVNPRLKQSSMAVSGERLYKKLSVIEKTFNTKFLFCKKADTGQRIIDLLSGRERA
ncbi:MAG: ERCC4 domain-containing protein [Ruminococcus sp.]